MSYNDYIKINEFKSTWLWYLALVIFLYLLPLFADDYFMYILCMSGIYVIVSLGINLLTGFSGQISLGHAAFYAIGAYASAILTTKVGIPFWFAVPLSGLIAAISGLMIAFPAFRMSGLYLAIATMAFGFIVEEVIINWESMTNGTNGYSVLSPSIGNFSFDSDQRYFYIVLTLTILMIFAAKNIIRSKTGRAFVAIRDSETAARITGINLERYKARAFGISAFYAGIGGSLLAHYTNFIGPDNFTIVHSIVFLAMIVVGGLGSIPGSILGGVFITWIPEVIKMVADYFPSAFQQTVGLHSLIYGGIIVVFLIFEPLGLYGRWLKIKFYYETFPYYRKETFRKQRKFYKTEKR